MTRDQKTALMIGLGALGGAAWVYYRERSGGEQLVDFALGAAATGAVLVLADSMLSEPEEILFNPLLPNPFMSRRRKEGMGRTSKKALALLSELNEDLYDDYKGNGVKIAAIPPNPAIVNQDHS